MPQGAPLQHPWARCQLTASVAAPWQAGREEAAWRCPQALAKEEVEDEAAEIDKDIERQVEAEGDAEDGVEEYIEGDEEVGWEFANEGVGAYKGQDLGGGRGGLMGIADVVDVVAAEGVWLKVGDGWFTSG